MTSRPVGYKDAPLPTNGVGRFLELDVNRLDEDALEASHPVISLARWQAEGETLRGGNGPLAGYHVRRRGSPPDAGIT